jgi:hypothetical protein
MAMLADVRRDGTREGGFVVGVGNGGPLSAPASENAANSARRPWRTASASSGVRWLVKYRKGSLQRIPRP